MLKTNYNQIALDIPKQIAFILVLILLMAENKDYQRDITKRQNLDFVCGEKLDIP